MIPVKSRNGQRMALFGLGGSGLISAQALIAGGADLIAYDDNPKRVEEAQRCGIPTGDLRTKDFASFSALVLSPGVPLTHPKPHWSVDLANSAGIPIIGDVSLFADERRAEAKDAPFIAITGTNGKSTTTALVSHILSHAGRDVQMGGNIGRAVLSLDPPETGKHYIVECSSYQIDLAPEIDPDTGILLNLAPDHLDRHGTMEHYAEVKKRLVEGAEVAIVGVDDPHSEAIAKALKSSGKDVVPISVERELPNGVFAKNGELFFSIDGNAARVADLTGIATLRGAHNAQNACAAWAACHRAGLSTEEIQAGLESFAGLAHRMEILGHIGDIVFVNDSKATNADAAAMALSSFENIHWIAGGLAKDGGIEGLRPYFDRITRAYLIGDAAPTFAASLGKEVAFEIAGTIEAAVENAMNALSGKRKGVVLLSPACASFDQFANFEKRGDAFRDAVEELEGFQPYGKVEK